MCLPNLDASGNAQHYAKAERDKSVPIGHRKGDGKYSAHDQTNRDISKERSNVVGKDIDPLEFHVSLREDVACQ